MPNDILKIKDNAPNDGYYLYYNLFAKLNKIHTYQFLYFKNCKWKIVTSPCSECEGYLVLQDLTTKEKYYECGCYGSKKISVFKKIKSYEFITKEEFSL